MTVSLRDTRSAELFARALQYLPGGVNSPVRAMRSIGRDPLFIERGAGAAFGAFQEVRDALTRGYGIAGNRNVAFDDLRCRGREWGRRSIRGDVHHVPCHLGQRARADEFDALRVEVRRDG